MAEENGKWRKWIWIAAVLGVLVVAAAAAWYFVFQGPPDPNQLMNKAWQKSVQADSYRFNTSTRLVVDGKERVLNRLQGEMAKNDFRISGQIINTKVEMMQIGSKLYIRDFLDSSRWRVMEKSSLDRQALVAAGINPLNYLEFKQLFVAKLVGEQKLGKRGVYQLEVQPDLHNQFLELLYTNFRATFLVGKWDHRIWQAVLVGQSKQKPQDKIIIEITILDYNNPVNLTPPVQAGTSPQS